MARSIEWFVLMTSIIVGLSHWIHAKDWSIAFRAMSKAGRPAAFANGLISLGMGAWFVIGHPVWSGPAIVVTIFGCLLFMKGIICLLFPDLAIRSMDRKHADRDFRIAGVAMLLLAAWVAFCLFRSHAET